MTNTDQAKCTTALTVFVLLIGHLGKLAWEPEDQDNGVEDDTGENF